MWIGTREFDPSSGEIRDRTGIVAALRPHAAEVLRLLAEAEGAVVSKDSLLERAWPGVTVSEDSLYQCITEIRRALGPDSRALLQTVPRRGYRLRPPSATGPTARRGRRPATMLAAAALLCSAFAAWHVWPRPGSGPPALSLTTTAQNAAAGALADALDAELGVVLARYRTISLRCGGAPAAYRLSVALRGTTDRPRVAVELTEHDTGRVVLADALDAAAGESRLRLVAARLGAAVASPLGGAVPTEIFRSAQALPVERLGREQCYATGFRIQSSGDDETARRAEACLNRLIEADPKDARALALLAALRAHQSWWATGLEGPARDDIALRRALVAQAVDLATSAEALSPEDDSVVHYSLGRAYYAACAREKLASAADRALALTPDDPNLLGAFGNWLAFAGAWDRGEALARRAIEIQPRSQAKWWYWALGKAHWRRGDYAEALEDFRKSYDERNWLSHLQMAYTLPALGREAEAAEAVRRLRELRPGLTRDDAADAYRG